MKLNNKGFAISSIMYLILILALILVSLIIALVINRRLLIDKQKKHVLNQVENNLILSKITYYPIPFDSSWIYTNASVDDGVLTIGTDDSSGQARSGYIDVNGGFFYFMFNGYAKFPSSSFSPLGGNLIVVEYYNSNHILTFCLANNNANGYGFKISLNNWNNNIRYRNPASWKALKRYGPYVKYIKMEFKAGDNNYSSLPVKISNLWFYGEKISNNFYDINLTLRNENQIALIKYDKGYKKKSYFQENGTVVSSTTIKVFENGVYTVYVKDTENNEYVSRIKITNITE